MLLTVVKLLIRTFDTNSRTYSCIKAVKLVSYGYIDMVVEYIFYETKTSLG
jgi:hypothetical protein